MLFRWALIAAYLPLLLQAQPKSVLYITHSAGFRHDSLPLSQQVMRDLGTRSGKFTVTATDDLSALNDLGRFSALVFFTSGELALSPQQREAILRFVRDGGGFAGVHSATDTLYTWPEYGDLIGGRFDGHPWTQEVRIDVEDPEHPATQSLSATFAIEEEIYQFREFSRDRVRVLLTLDTTSVDTGIAGVNRSDGDFALAWTRLYGNGRVYYNALGHFDATWRDPRFQKMLEEAILWITGQAEGDGRPRAQVDTGVASNGVGNAATMRPPMTISPGSFVSIFGTNLTSGPTMATDARAPSYRLAGTRVLLNGRVAPLVYASPGQINLLAPLDLLPEGDPLEITVEAAGSVPRTVQARLASFTPGIFVASPNGPRATLWSTGLGAVEQRGDLYWTVASTRATVNGIPAPVTFSGLAPGWPGLYQVNIDIPASAAPPFTFQLTIE